MEKKYIIIVKTLKPWADPEDFLTVIDTFNRANKDVLEVHVETPPPENPLLKEYHTVEEAMSDMLTMGMDINHYIQAKYGEEFKVRNLAMLLAVMTSTFLIAENITPETYTQLLHKTYTLLKLAEALRQ
jgi:hypothetical protein